MITWWPLPSSARYVAPSASVKSVPSLKMLPTSMPWARRTGSPQSGQGSPSRALAMSTVRSGVKSRPTLTLRRWKPWRLAPATRFGERAASSSTTTTVSCAPTGEP